MISTKQEFLEALRNVPCEWEFKLENERYSIQSDSGCDCVMLKMSFDGLGVFEIGTWTESNSSKIFKANDGFTTLDPEIAALRKEILEACRLQEP